MKNRKYGSSLLLLALPILFVPFSCKPASLEYIGAKKRQSNDDKPTEQTEVKPNNPGQTGSGNPNGNLDGSNANNALPVAGVEIIRNGVPTNEAYVNQEVRIRPTKETVDGDDKAKTDCINAGITKAEYDFGDGSKQTIERKSPCEPLDVLHTYQSTGAYKVTLVVYTAENETAQASTQLVVLSGSGSGSTSGFTTTGGVPVTDPNGSSGSTGGTPGQYSPTPTPTPYYGGGSSSGGSNGGCSCSGGYYYYN